MQPAPKQTVKVFDAYREVQTSTGSKFYWLTSSDSNEVCRVDERFSYLIESTFPLLDQNQGVEYMCIPDIRDPRGWRLDLDHYRAEMLSASSDKSTSTDPIDNDLKSITFYVSSDDHAFLTALHKRIKQVDPTFTRFSDLNAYHFTTLVRTLKMQHPDLAASTRPLPF